MSEQTEKIKMISEMLKDLGLEGNYGYWEPWQEELCDKLIRAGWRKQ